MNNNVIEIISLLIRKMLQDKDVMIEEEKIIQELIKFGYKVKDIDEAFELIYNTTDIIETENIQIDDFEKIPYFYNRIFSIAEKLYLPLNLQGLIRRLIVLNILTPRESEELIIKAIQNSYNGFTSASDLWDLLEEIVVDQKKLDFISSEIVEFANFIPSNFKYVN